MLPLNYAILKEFTKQNVLSAQDIIAALDKDYHSFQAFSLDKVNEALMTAEKNGLITEKSYDLDPEGQLRVFYTVDAEQVASINKYIK